MGFSLARDAEASDVLMLNKDDILSDRFERKMRNLNQLRRSSVVSGMKVSLSPCFLVPLSRCRPARCTVASPPTT
jgi:hypothetical protein